MNFLCAEYDYEMDMQVKGEEAFEHGLEQGMRRGVERGVKAFILDNLEENRDKETIINKLTLRFALSKKQAKELFDKYSE